MKQVVEEKLGLENARKKAWAGEKLE